MALYTLILFIALLGHARDVAAHGYLTMPPAKQLIDNMYGVTLQHGNSIGFGGGRPIPSPGVCGDPFQESNSNVASTPFLYQTPWVYSVNGIIRINLTLTANHGGRHMFRVCPATTPSAACFGNNYLTATGNPTGGENPVEGKRYWYINFQGPSRFATYPYETYASNWRLPAGVSCDNGCLLQWSWSAYQNCALPCEDSSWDDPARCGLDQRGARQICDGSANFFAEVFNNCADIRITTGTVAAAPPPPATLSPPPALSNTPSPTVTRSPPPPVAGSPAGPSGGASCPITDTAAYCLSKGAGLWSDPCACAYYYNCGAGGVGARMPCPAGLYWNAAAQYCDWPANVQCP